MGNGNDLPTHVHYTFRFSAKQWSYHYALYGFKHPCAPLIVSFTDIRTLMCDLYVLTLVRNPNYAEITLTFQVQITQLACFTS